MNLLKADLDKYDIEEEQTSIDYSIGSDIMSAINENLADIK